MAKEKSRPIVDETGSKEKPNEFEAVSSEGTRALIRDVQRLTKYAIQKGELPDGTVDAEVIFQASRDWESKGSISVCQFKKLIEYYQVLERLFTNVTAASLEAGERKDPDRFRSSRVGNYLWRLWTTTAIVVFLILATNILQFVHGVSQPESGDEWGAAAWALNIGKLAIDYLEPFLYGALGSLAYLLRLTGERLNSQEFDASRIPEHMNRLALGSLSGGAIILFIAQVPTEEGASIEIGAAALGFLAGYSVDFLFQTIDRIIQAILPKIGLDTIQVKSKKRWENAAIRRYQSMMEKTKSDETKEILRGVINDMRTRQ